MKYMNVQHTVINAVYVYASRKRENIYGKKQCEVKYWENLWFVINQANDVEVNQFIEITANETINQKLLDYFMEMWQWCAHSLCIL